jgi:hypothetical protein
MEVFPSANTTASNFGFLFLIALTDVAKKQQQASAVM